MPLLRHCTFRKNGSPLTIRMTANNGLRAGGVFALYDMGKNLLEHWVLAPGDDGAATHILQTPPSQLDGCEMSWRVKVCGFIPSVDSGLIDLEISQNGQACPMAPTAAWNATDVPACESGQVLPKTFSLIFEPLHTEIP